MSDHSRRRVWGIVLIVVLATPWARAGDPLLLQGLGDAMQGRVDAITELASPTKAEKKEAKLLGKAVSKLAAYTGDDDKPGLALLAKVASYVGKAKTADEGVIAGAAALHDLLEQVAELARQDALNEVTRLEEPKHAAGVEKLVAKGDKRLGIGLTLWPTNHGKGAKKINSATITYRNALAKADKKQAAEAKKHPNDVRVTGLDVLTPDPQIFHELSVAATVQADQPVPELTLALRAALQQHVDGDASEFTQTTLGETTLLDVPAGTSHVVLEYPMPIVRDETFVKVTSDDPTKSQRFGQAIAVSGTTLVVGSYENGAAGSARVFSRDKGGLLHWGEVAQLVFSDYDPQAPNTDDDFGCAVAISGDTVVVGARQHDLQLPDGTAEDAGAAYVFQRDAGGPDAWGQVAVLIADPADDPGCGLTRDFADFGHAVAIDGDTIVVGAPGASWCDGHDQPFAGEAYVFERDAGGEDAWGQVARLRDPNGSKQYRFGYAVAIDGDHIAVGMGDKSYLSGSATHGRVYWFSKHPGLLGWNESYVTRLEAGDGYGSNGDGFGTSLALTGDTLVVGAPRTKLPAGKTGAGAAYVFDTTILSDECNFFEDCGWIARLTAEDAAADDAFGTAVAIMSTPAGRQGIAVGAPRGDYGGVTDAGATYVFHRDLGGTNAYGQLLKVITDGDDVHITADNLDAYGSPDPSDPYAIFGPNTFGAAVAADGEKLVLGAPLANLPEAVDCGALWIFDGLEFVVAGDYAVAVQVDPHDRILETANPDAEDNNIFAAEAPVTFGDDAFNTPNVTLVSADVEPDAILWDTTEGVQATLVGIDTTVLMTGKHDAPLEGVLYRVSATVGGDESPGQIWDEAAGGYVSAFVLPPLFADIPQHLHLDVRLPPPPGNQPSYAATLHLSALPLPSVAEYDPDDPSSDATADDYADLDTSGYQLVKLPDCTYTKTYAKSLGNSDIGASIAFEANLDLTKNLAINDVHVLFPDSKASAGAVASAQGAVDLTVMGHELELVRFNALIERDPIQHYAFFGADLLYQNPITGEFDVLYSAGPYDTTDIEADPGNPLDDPPDGFQFCDGDNGCESGFLYTKDFSVEKNTNDPKGVKKSKTFYPGGVPVTVQGVVEGKLGFEITGIAADEFSLEAKPHAGLSATIKLAVGDCDVLCIGAGGEIVLVQDEFKAKAGIGMTIVTDDDNDPPAYQNINANMCFRVANEVTLLNGKLFVFARYPWFKWCKTFFGHIPCGFTIQTSKKDIIDWTAFVYCSELVNKYKSICCEPVIGAETDVCDDNGIGSTVCASETCHG